MDTSTVTVTRRTLEETPGRSLTFLRAVARKAHIRQRLQSRGYTQAEHDKGWRLIGLVSGVDLQLPAPIEDHSVRHALAELNSLDEDTLALVELTLKHRHPAQAEVLLGGLSPTRDEAGAVVVIATLSERLDQLEREKTDEGDKALALLSERGLDSQERGRLKSLVEQARRAAPVAQTPDAATAEAAEASYLENLKLLRAWYEEWSGIARIVIKRRDHLIQLGLATRRSPNTSNDDPDDTQALDT